MCSAQRESDWTWCVSRISVSGVEETSELLYRMVNGSDAAVFL